MKQKVPVYLKALLILIVVLILFSAVVPLVSAIIPGQLYRWYVVTALAVILLYVSSSEATWQEFLVPFRKLLLAHTAFTKPFRAVVFLVLPFVVGWYVSTWAPEGGEAPGGLRVVHPAPPSVPISFQGKSIDLGAVTINPLRADAARLPENIEQGRQIYYKNCFFCHGDGLRGEGHFAKGFNPLPANFKDPGTIEMLSESFLFWRIAKGGPGLPGASTPWDSAMPVWENYLNETEIWQVILYLYHTAGHKPRVMDEGGHGGH